MKLSYLVLAAPLLFLACDNENEVAPSEKTFKVTSFSSVDIGINAVVKFDPSFPAGEVHVTGRPTDVSKVRIEVKEGVLWIQSDDAIDLADSLTVSASSRVLTNIVLEADQKAVINWNDLSDHDILRIKTEANSILEVHQLRAAHVDVQQEAQSKVTLRAWTWHAHDSLKTLKTDVIKIDDKTFLIEDEGIVIVDSFEELDEDGSVYYVLRAERIKRYFIIPYMNVKLEATSDLFAEESPIVDLDIKLEGESEARVWVLNRISGKGEGKSVLHLKGDPDIDYVTQGEATITGL